MLFFRLPICPTAVAAACGKQLNFLRLSGGSNFGVPQRLFFTQGFSQYVPKFPYANRHFSQALPVPFCLNQ
jgi:hypothetical protein